MTIGKTSKTNKVNAALVTVWAGGNKIQTGCFYNEKQNTVHGIDPVDPHEFSTLLDEYIVYKDEIVKNYLYENNFEILKSSVASLR